VTFIFIPFVATSALTHGISTVIKTFTIKPNTTQQINIDMNIPPYINPGTYTLTAELDEYYEGGVTPMPTAPVVPTIQPR